MVLGMKKTDNGKNQKKISENAERWLNKKPSLSSIGHGMLQRRSSIGKTKRQIEMEIKWNRWCGISYTLRVRPLIPKRMHASKDNWLKINERSAYIGVGGESGEETAGVHVQRTRRRVRTTQVVAVLSRYRVLDWLLLRLISELPSENGTFGTRWCALRWKTALFEEPQSRCVTSANRCFSAEQNDCSILHK